MINETFNEGTNKNGNVDNDDESHGASDDDDDDGDNGDNNIYNNNTNDDDDNDNNKQQVKIDNEDNDVSETSPVAIIIATVNELYAYTEEHVSNEDQKRIVINFLKKIVKRYEMIYNGEE